VSAPETLHAMRDLVDRQIVDVDELLAGKVDDLLLECGDDATRVAGLLTGAGALAPRIGGRLGAGFEDLVRRFSAPQWEPQCLSPDRFRRTHSGIALTVPREYARGTAPRAPVHRRSPCGPIAALDDLRLSDLIGSEVFDSDGAAVGAVGDARLLLAGPAVGEVGVEMTLDALLVGLGSVGERLGFPLRRGPRRPLVLHRAFRTVASHARDVPWASVDRLEPRAVHLHVGRDELRGLPDPGA
jgi:hypothetical protein